MWHRRASGSPLWSPSPMSDSQETAIAPREVAGAVDSTSPATDTFGIDWWTLLTDPAFLRNPYPDLKRIRDLAPIHFDPASGVYFVLGYREFGMMAKTP